MKTTTYFFSPAQSLGFADIHRPKLFLKGLSALTLGLILGLMLSQPTSVLAQSSAQDKMLQDLRAGAGGGTGAGAAGMSGVSGTGSAGGGSMPVNTGAYMPSLRMSNSIDPSFGLDKPNPALQQKPVKPTEPSQFQRYVRDTTGKLLPVYGQDLFDNPQAYSADSVAPTPPDYVLGAGDEVRVQIWGSLDYAGSH